MDFSKTLATVAEKIIDIAFRTVWFVLTLFVLAVGLKVLPDSLLETIGLGDFVDRYSEQIGLVLFVSAVIILMIIIRYLYARFQIGRNKFEVKREKERKLERNVEAIRNLTLSQDYLLYQFISERRRTRTLDENSEDVRALEDLGFILRDSGAGSRTLYSIEPWVRDQVANWKQKKGRAEGFIKN